MWQHNSCRGDNSYWDAKGVWKGMWHIKLDMKKKYDRLEWDILIRFNLCSVKLNDHYVNMIMKCATSATMKVTRMWAYQIARATFSV